jgi:hypothetical protein
MQTLTAKILDSTHLELSHPIFPIPGEMIQIAILETEEEEQLWKEATINHFTQAYDDQDAIYDKL